MTMLESVRHRKLVASEPLAALFGLPMEDDGLVVCAVGHVFALASAPTASPLDALGEVFD